MILNSPEKVITEADTKRRESLTNLYKMNQKPWKTENFTFFLKKKKVLYFIAVNSC